MSPATQRAAAVAAAAAHDFNDELTIIFSCVCDALSSLEPGHPAREQLLQARGSAQRCAWKNASLLNYAMHAGIQMPRASTERMIRFAETGL